VPVRLEAGDPKVTVDVPATAGSAQGTLAYKPAALSNDQTKAADEAGLAPTNIAFELALQPASMPAPKFEVTSSYLPQQVMGLPEAQLSLYRYDPAANVWQALDGCKTDTAVRKVSCTGSNAGLFMLAGPEPSTPSTLPLLAVGVAIAAMGAAATYWVLHHRTA